VSPLRANTRTSWMAGECDGPATLRLAEICQRRRF
jgi:hypothetical protein